MSEPLPGDYLAHYRLERLLDDGGQSQVWIAHDQRLNRNVALKVLTLANPAEAEAERQRFEQTSRIAARIEHPGVIAVFECGATASIAYLAMRYTPGRSLDLWQISKTSASVDVRFQVLSPVAEALDHAHALGVAHGSVVAPNILVDESVQPQRGALAQFGRSMEPTDVSDQPARAIEGDRIAFAHLLTTVFSVPVSATSPTNTVEESCFELLRRVAEQQGHAVTTTPTTSSRTRRTQTRRRRAAVIATTAATILIIIVSGLELLQDGLSTFSSNGEGGADSGASELVSTSGASGTAPVPPGKVLILGSKLTSSVGAWAESNRTSVFQMRKGVDAADVVQSALVTNPATMGMDTVRVPLRGSAGACSGAVQQGLDQGPFWAIVVLESPCTLTVARLLAARENKLPPVYWLDGGSLSEDSWGASIIAPTADLDVSQYPDATSGLLTAVGPHTGENFARVLPFGTYRDVGKFVEQEQLATGPCFYLATRDFERGAGLGEYEAFENFRIASSISELAHGFDVATSQIGMAEVVPPLDNNANAVLPTNGTITGSISDDQKLIDKVRESSAKCVVIETGSSTPRWDLRLVSRLAKDLPDITLVNHADPSDAYAPWVDLPPNELEAFDKLMRHPSLYSLSLTPYVSPDAPLAAHFDSVIETQYEPVDYDRLNAWLADDYALVLVAELIGAQPADRGDGRPDFGRLEKTLWATVDALLDTAAPVQLDPVDRIYSGYLVQVYHKGELHDAFYGGLTESP